MTDLTLTTSPLPAPRIAGAISIRVATLADLPFMDSLQKQHTKQVGYFPTKQFEGYIEMGGVLIAEERHEGTEARRHEGEEGESASCIPSVPPCLRASVPVAYCISRDRYLKRDELGVIYQLCVGEGQQRKLIGATLLKSVFDRAAYGCRLFCCWCAQDIAANRFWESMGFVPVAFRAGSSGKRRVHIFWQKRINADDFETKYWYPCQTNSGAIREDRLVFPIPPGVHWSEVKAVAMPLRSEKPALEPPQRMRVKKASENISVSTPTMETRGLRFAAIAQASEVPIPKPPRAAKPKVKVEPRLVAAARELRDRWLEKVNADASTLLAAGKYHVCKELAAPAKRLLLKAA